MDMVNKVVMLSEYLTSISTFLYLQSEEKK